MYSGVIATELSRRGYDVEAVVFREDLIHGSDAGIIRVARDEGRVVVTENMRDFRAQMDSALRIYGSHAGVILVDPRNCPRGDDRTIGRMVTALDALLREDIDLTNKELWLRPS